MCECGTISKTNGKKENSEAGQVMKNRALCFGPGVTDYKAELGCFFTHKRSALVAETFRITTKRAGHSITWFCLLYNQQRPGVPRQMSPDGPRASGNREAGTMLLGWTF